VGGRGPKDGPGKVSVAMRRIMSTAYKPGKEKKRRAPQKGK